MSISEEEAKELFEKFTELKSKFELTQQKTDKMRLERHKNVMIEKLKYIVVRKTSAYKKYHNYDDLNQDGFEALIMGLNNFDPKKGSIFWWLHKYIDTRIARKANAHSVVKVPIKVAKATPPKMETISLFAEDTSNNPEEEFIKKNKLNNLEEKINKLDKDDKDFINKFIDSGNDKKSIKELCDSAGINKVQLQTKVKKIISKMK